MNTVASSINEEPLQPKTENNQISQTPTRTMPPVQPMELWAFLENSDFVRRKAIPLYRQDEVDLIRHDEFLEADYHTWSALAVLGYVTQHAGTFPIRHPDAMTGSGWTGWSRLQRSRISSCISISGITAIRTGWISFPPKLPCNLPNLPLRSRSAIPRWNITVFVTSQPARWKLGGRQGQWGRSCRQDDPSSFRRQISRMIIDASKAILEVRPEAV